LQLPLSHHAFVTAETDAASFAVRTKDPHSSVDSVVLEAMVEPESGMNVEEWRLAIELELMQIAAQRAEDGTKQRRQSYDVPGSAKPNRDNDIVETDVADSRSTRPSDSSIATEQSMHEPKTSISEDDATAAAELQELDASVELEGLEYEQVLFGALPLLSGALSQLPYCCNS